MQRTFRVETIHPAVLLGRALGPGKWPREVSHQILWVRIRLELNRQLDHSLRGVDDDEVRSSNLPSLRRRAVRRPCDIERKTMLVSANRKVPGDSATHIDAEFGAEPGGLQRRNRVWAHDIFRRH